MGEALRWILGLFAFALGSYVVLLQLGFVLAWGTRGIIRQFAANPKDGPDTGSTSLVPVVGGFMLCLATLTLPIKGLSSLWWLALLVDFTIPMTLLLLLSDIVVRASPGSD